MVALNSTCAFGFCCSVGGYRIPPLRDLDADVPCCYVGASKAESSGAISGLP